MGLFDYVSVHQPGFDPKEEFQTKDFDDPYMHEYVIASDGRLKLEEEDLNFHGILNFYTSRGEDWVDCHAKFTDGELVSIHVKTITDR